MFIAETVSGVVPQILWHSEFCGGQQEYVSSSLWYVRVSDGLHNHSSCIDNTTVTSACVTADVVTYTVRVITRRSSTRAMMPEKLIVVFHIGHSVIVLLQADCSIWAAPTENCATLDITGSRPCSLTGQGFLSELIVSYVVTAIRMISR